jgi:hypothetical protein
MAQIDSDVMRFMNAIEEQKLTEYTNGNFSGDAYWASSDSVVASAMIRPQVINILNIPTLVSLSLKGS